MAKTDWTINDEVEPVDMNEIGQEINQLREDVDNIHIPPATLTEAGIVKLSNATDNPSEIEAATPKAVKAAYDRAEQAFQSASNGKELIAAAITGKGVPASGSDTFAQLGGKIGQISIGATYFTNMSYNNKPITTASVREELLEIPTGKSNVGIMSVEANNGTSLYNYTIYATTWTSLTTEQTNRIEVSLLLIDNKGQTVNILYGKYEGQGVQPKAHTMISVLLMDRINKTVTFRGGTGGPLEVKTVTLPSNFNASGPIKLVAEHSKNFFTTEDTTFRVGGVQKAYTFVN